MMIGSLAADADVVGGRIRVSWSFTPEAGETVADVPRVTLRRKERDFAFPAVTSPDPYTVYDSAAFPPSPVPGTLQVSDLPDRELTDGALRVREQTITVADIVMGRPRETLRRTIRTVFAADRKALRQDVELLDVRGPLTPGVPQYYELDSPVLAPGVERAPFRVTATPGADHGLSRMLYELIPDIHRRHDAVPRPRDAATGLLPEASLNGGQLRRFVEVLGSGLDALRSSAEGLWNVHDAAGADPRFLEPLAHWIGWDVTTGADLPRQRNEIRNAPRLYEAVGTIPGFATIVDHYTGWSTRVAEFAEHVARANVAPQRNLYALVERAGDWWGLDDVAPLLGFAPPNADDSGGAGVAAELVGAATEPFALRANMTITIAVDGALPATITLGPANFADPAAATAAEVAAVLAAEMTELTADAVGGAVRLRSHRIDAGSRVQVLAAGPSLLSLDGAPAGRLAAFADPMGRLFVAHATTVGPGAGAPSRLQVKPYLRGTWYDTQPVDSQPQVETAHPAGVALADGVWLAFVEGSGRDGRLRWRRGSARPLTPAQLLGELSAPFVLVPGTRVVFTGYGPSETFVVNAADYTAASAATAAEVAAAINAQLAGVVATPAANGAIAVRTAATGPGVALRVDLAASTAARALGLADRALVGRGGWDSAIDWGPVQAVTTVAPGHHADCAAAVDPAGAVRLFWSTHRAGRWRIARVRWDDRVLAATAGGVGIRLPSGTWTSLTAAGGLPSDDVRGIAVDADGSTWYATDAGAAVRRPDGSMTTLSAATTGGGLADDDVRAGAVAQDGTAWFAHAAGASALTPAGAWQTVAAVDGLASDDCRHVTAAPDGAVWFATAGGLSRLAPGSIWTTWTVTDGLPTDDVRFSAIAGDGTLWAATAAGLAAVGRDGAVHAVGLVAAGAPAGADDVRTVTPDEGSLWAATAAGVIELDVAGRVRSHGLADGLPSLDCRGVLVAPDGAVWVATAAGAARRAAGAAGWVPVTTAQGLPANDVRALHGPWSTALEFAPAGAGDRDPFVTFDDTDRLWLAWSELQQPADRSDTWLLRARRFAWPGPAWSATLALTAVPPPPDDRATDREPCVVPLSGGGARLFLRSDRSGGPRLWTADVSAADAVSVLAPITEGEAGDSAPTAISVAGTVALVFRSDRSVPLARLGGGVPAGDDDAFSRFSRRAPAEASVRRFAGAATAALNDLDRNRSRRRFEDLLSYTPQKPRGPAEVPLEPDELYTRGTIGLYVERGPAGLPLTAADADRLRQLLDRFLPANLRAVIVLRPSPALLEEVFGPGQLSDSFSDVYPFADVYAGVIDSTAAVLPDWRLFLTVDGASVTADPGDLTTLRRRSWWPPPL